MTRILILTEAQADFIRASVRARAEDLGVRHLITLHDGKHFDAIMRQMDKREYTALETTKLMEEAVKISRRKA